MEGDKKRLRSGSSAKANGCHNPFFVLYLTTERAKYLTFNGLLGGADACFREIYV